MITKQLKWNEEIDAALCRMHEDQGISDWVQVSNRLNCVFGQPLRLPKQCRERYINCLKFRESAAQWSKEQLKILHDSYLLLGPKWVKISKQIPGRGQNSIKNKFNAALRKTLRRLNQICKTRLEKHRKQIDSEWFQKLTKVVFENGPEIPDKKIFAKKLMQQLISLIFPDIDCQLSSTWEKQSQQVLENICSYNKNYLFCKKRQRAIFSQKIKQQPAIKLEHPLISNPNPLMKNILPEEKLANQNSQESFSEYDHFSLQLLQNNQQVRIKDRDQNLINYITQNEENRDQSFKYLEYGQPFDFFRN